jgi:plastocyanin
VGAFAYSLAIVSGLVLWAAMSAFAQEIVTVQMFDTPAKFVPDAVTVKPGQTVKWVNKGETIHTATADVSQAPDPRWVSIPSGAQPFDSGYLNAGESFTHVFVVPGTYKYFCVTHQQEGMRGKVIVQK